MTTVGDPVADYQRFKADYGPVERALSARDRKTAEHERAAAIRAAQVSGYVVRKNARADAAAALVEAMGRHALAVAVVVVTVALVLAAAIL